MTTVLLVLLSLLAFGLCILLGALVELFNQVQQIRTQLGMVDRATPLDLGAKRDALASTVGLPAVLDDTGDAMVLFLSNRCTTCRAIAHELDGTVPPGVWIVAEPVTGDDQEAEAFLREARRWPGPGRPADPDRRAARPQRHHQRHLHRERPAAPGANSPVIATALRHADRR